MTYCFVNSMFSQDAGPPIFPIEIAYWNTAFSEIHINFQDLNLEIYEYMNRDINTYHIIAAIFGGYVFSYPLSAFVPFNEYPFEALPTAELLIAMLYDQNIIPEELEKVCICYGLPFEDSYKHIQTFLNFFEKRAKEISYYDTILINMPSPASVIPGIYLAYKIKAESKNKIVIGIGNQINVPEIAQLGMALNAFDTIEGGNFSQTAHKVLSFLNFDDGSIKPGDTIYPSFDGIDVHNYPVYHGLKIVPLSTSEGCTGICNFCSERMNWDHRGTIFNKYATKSMDIVIQEIDSLKTNLHLSGITLNDCLLNANKKRAVQLFKELRKTKLLYSGSLRVDRLDEELILTMKEARFTDVIIGLETVSESSIDLYNKGGKNYKKAAWDNIPLLFENKIIPQINILICHPYEAVRQVDHAIESLITFKNFLESNGIPFFGAPVGTVCINYPSETYFRIRKDSEFEIVYHNIPKGMSSKVPYEVQKAINNIPLKAIKLSEKKYANINKIEYSSKVYDLWSKDINKQIEIKLISLIQHKDIFIDSWKKNSIYAVPNNRHYIFEDEGSTAVERIVKHCFKGIKNELSVFLKNEKFTDTAVETILTLSLNGAIRLVRGESV